MNELNVLLDILDKAKPCPTCNCQPDFVRQGSAMMVWCDNRFDYAPTGGECPYIKAGVGSTLEEAVADWNAKAST